MVASQVRNIAQRSAMSAKEIKGLIQNSVRKVEGGSELVNRSGQNLGEIVASVKRVTEIVAEMAAAAREQATGIDQVNKAITQMDQVTQANAGQTEEMSSTAQALSSQAEQLRALVGQFKLDADGQGAPRAAHVTRAMAEPGNLRGDGGVSGACAPRNRLAAAYGSRWRPRWSSPRACLPPPAAWT